MVLLMTGFDRTHLPSRGLRKAAADPVTAAAIGLDPALCRNVSTGQVRPWDLFTLSRSPVEATSAWAQRTLDGVLASAEARRVAELDCEDCEDVGFYGITAAANSDTLVGLVRRRDDRDYEQLTASGAWRPYASRADVVLEILTRTLADDLADAITAGASGLVRRYFWPQAFLPPETMLAAGTAPELTAPSQDVTPDEAAKLAETEGWQAYALVDDLDPGAVLSLIRLRTGPELTAYTAGGAWVEDNDILTQLTGPQPPPLVPLDEDQLVNVIGQIESAGPASAPGATTAAGLVADAPLTVSPDPRAEKLRRYWTTGKGAAKIRWGTPGDWTRCYRQLRKHMGVRAKGYCQNLHKRATGSWTGSRLNASGAEPMAASGLRARGAISMEAALVASVSTGAWLGPDQGGDPMLKDGVYAEAGADTALLKALTAGGFPVAPPDEWYQDPQLDGPTPLTVDDDGRVHGHIATFDIAHIGLPGRVHAPKSKSDYAYFKTGELVTASGSRVNVGQLTLAGGHASLQADAAAAAAHYDSTGSACADVNVGEDKFGIWVAGGLRPEVTPSQLRVLRASAPSGDWRPINGNLELVACVQVNVPGFPTTRARVASGAITALVAAGARPLYAAKMALMADAAILERVTALEAHIYGTDEVDLTETASAEGMVAETPADVVVADGDPVTLPEDGEGEDETEETPAEVEVEQPEPVVDVVTEAVTEEPVAPVTEEPVAEPVTQPAETPEEVPAEGQDTPEVPENIRKAREAAAARRETAEREARRAELRARVHGTAEPVAAAAP